MIGYLSELDCRPGDKLDVMVSSDAAEVSIDLVRLINGDDRPEAPGLRYQIIENVPQQIIKPQLHKTAIGSYGHCAVDVAFKDSLNFVCELYPTLPKNDVEQGIFWLPGLDIRLSINHHSRLMLVSRDNVLLESDTLDFHQWININVIISEEKITLILDGNTVTEKIFTGDGVVLKGYSHIIIAAAGGAPDDGRFIPSGIFNGKISNPQFSSGHVLIAGWDFSTNIKGQFVPAMTASQCQNRLDLVNAPQRAVTGPQWKAKCYDWTQVPEQYNAIHFHDDDLSDACWPVAATLVIPEDLASGIYAVRLHAEDLRDDLIPIIITPGKVVDQKPVLLVLPTYTYMAYANERLTEGDYNKTSKLPLNRGVCEDLLTKNPEWGKSVYDRHNDGSGVAYTSSRRPIPNYRPDYQFWGFSGPRRFPIDLYIVWFLTSFGYEFDVISEHYLDAVGSKAFDGYKAVLSGCQPEYCSEKMLDAWQDYYHSGGNLMYLGGDGFYWVTTGFSDAPYLLEVRKSEGFRHWECEPGERYHASTGELGGLWRTRGRSAHKLFGVGIGGAGWDETTPGFTRSAVSYQDKYAWIFKDIRQSVIGDFGLIMNGTSGDEIDRVDYRLGTPKSTVILASAIGHSEWFVTIPEDIMKVSNRLNATYNPGIRSDMVMIGEPGHGCVFSVGSITFCGGLPVNNGDNNVAQLIRNLLDGFINTPLLGSQ